MTGINSPYAPDKLDCAKAGVRALLQSLPSFTAANGTTTAYDDVGILVFPALEANLTGTTTYSSVSFNGTVKKNSQNITGISTNLSAYVGDSGESVSGTDVPSGATITSITKSGSGSSTTYTIALSVDATSSAGNGTSGSFSFSQPSATTSAPYSFPTSPPMTPPDDETDCDSSDSFGVTYPPYHTYTYTAGATGGIPSSYLGTQNSTGTLFTPYASPGYVDNFPGYEAVPLSSDYLTDSGGTVGLATGSNLVESVYWAQCTAAEANGNGAGNFPGGDYYGIKDIGGQGSYLAGAITEAQYLLAEAAAAQPTRTINGTAYPVSSGIVILSDGELNDPKSGSDGVDPDATSGNISFSSTQPCEDALKAATAAQNAGTVIFSIAYDDSGGDCDDGSGGYNGSASTLMLDFASSTADFADESSDAGDLTSAFTEAANELTGNSALIPDCTAAPPNC
ncbi:MAG TPA: hypothetical protein VHU61_11400 [Solirubrobacteraceae bacterium]|nr:hypothetical protein [Solirubrobacteraceae bacterium]